MLGKFTLKDGRSLLVDRAFPEDAPEILSYINTIGGETEFLTFGSEGISLSVEAEAEYLKSMLDPNLGLYLKGTVSGRIVAGLIFSRINRPRLSHTGEFGVSVLSAFWGLGICRALLETLVRWSEQSGIRKINLRVHERNERAIRLYERFGFVHEGKRSRAFCTKGQFFAENLMGLELNPMT